MIHEYALDPEVLLAWAANDRDYAEFFREYGLGTPRVFSSFPRMKASKLRSYFLQNSPGNEQTLVSRRYTEMVQKLTEDVVIRESQENNTKSWSEYVVAEDARLPFGVILSEQHIASDRCITRGDMHVRGGIWTHADQLNIQRTHEGFCTAVFNLLRFATDRVVVIDAYGWTPEAIIQMQYLVRCVLQDRVSERLPHMTLFFKKNQKSPNAAHVRNEILNGMNLNGTVIQIDVLELEEIPGNDIFHNRCILTEHGGVKTGHGIGVTGDHAHTDEAVLLNSVLYHKKWKQFMEDRCFNIVSQS